MEARPLPAFISKKPKSIHPPTRQPLDLHSQTHSGGPRLDEVRVAEKRGCKHAAVLLWSASQVQIRERAEKMAPRPCYRRLLVAWVAGAVPPVAICVPRPEPGSSRSNVLPVPGKDLGCGGSYLPPQVQLAQPTHSSPALS